MNVLITVSYYSPYISGLTNSVKNLADGLSKRGHNTIVLTTQYDRSLATNSVNGAETIRVPYLFRINKGFFMPTYIWQAFVLIKQSSVVLIALPQFEGVIVAMISRLLGKKLYCYYLCEVSLPKSFFNFVAEKTLHVSNFISMLFAQRIITLTADYAKASKFLRLFLGKTKTIFPLINVPKKSKLSSEKLRSRIPKKTYYVGFIGRIAAEKGIEYLLETIPSIEKRLGDDFLVLIAGPERPIGEDAYFKKIKRLFIKFEEHLFFLGTLREEELGAFYSLLDVLVIPSINSTEAFGMVQVEAMLLGTPVVASDLPGVKTPILYTKMGELFTPKNEKELAGAILKVLENRKAYTNKSLVKKAKEVFSNKKIFNFYERLLKETSYI